MWEVTWDEMGGVKVGGVEVNGEDECCHFGSGEEVQEKWERRSGCTGIGPGEYGVSCHK